MSRGHKSGLPSVLTTLPITSIMGISHPHVISTTKRTSTVYRHFRSERITETDTGVSWLRGVTDGGESGQTYKEVGECSTQKIYSNEIQIMYKENKGIRLRILNDEEGV